MKKVVKIEIDCANCAQKVERALNKIEGVNSAAINFMAGKLILDLDESRYATLSQEIVKTAKRIESDCEISGL